MRDNAHPELFFPESHLIGEVDVRRVIAWTTILFCLFSLVFVLMTSGWRSLEVNGFIPYERLRTEEPKQTIGLWGLLRDEINWHEPEFSIWVPVITCASISLLGVSVAHGLLHHVIRLRAFVLLSILVVANLLVPAVLYSHFAGFARYGVEWLIFSPIPKGLVQQLLAGVCLTLAITRARSDSKDA